MTKLAVSCGDPAGIGPDICIKAFGTGKILQYKAVVFGDPDLIKERAIILDQNIDIQIYSGESEKELSDSVLWIKPHLINEEVIPGEPKAKYAKYIMGAFKDAIKKTISKEFDALVTGPINKEIMNAGGFNFKGHTEVLAEASDTSQVLMMLVNKNLKVALATTHVPLSKVPSLITTKHVRGCLEILNEDLKKYWGLKNPRIKVLGVNPHAGDGGYLGSEEEKVLKPLIEDLNKDGFNLVGPVSADTAFIDKYDTEKIDAVLAMFHDQGLPAIKTLGFGEIVNITLGLPFIRTSVDHGTAYDMAGKLKADESSILKAATLAKSMCDCS